LAAYVFPKTVYPKEVPNLIAHLAKQIVEKVGPAPLGKNGKPKDVAQYLRTKAMNIRTVQPPEGKKRYETVRSKFQYDLTKDTDAEDLAKAAQSDEKQSQLEAVKVEGGDEGGDELLTRVSAMDTAAADPGGDGDLFADADVAMSENQTPQVAPPRSRPALSSKPPQFPGVFMAAPYRPPPALSAATGGGTGGDAAFQQARDTVQQQDQERQQERQQLEGQEAAREVAKATLTVALEAVRGDIKNAKAEVASRYGSRSTGAKEAKAAAQAFVKVLEAERALLMAKVAAYA
jgi:hypothetical protein